MDWNCSHGDQRQHRNDTRRDEVCDIGVSADKWPEMHSSKISKYRLMWNSHSGEQKILASNRLTTFHWMFQVISLQDT
jgi:hypothetical protein